MKLNEISGAIVDAAYHLHSQTGPGLLESLVGTFSEACFGLVCVGPGSTRVSRVGLGVSPEPSEPLSAGRRAQHARRVFSPDQRPLFLQCLGACPGAVYSVYEELLTYELTKRGLRFERQKPIPSHYDGRLFELGFRADLVVEDAVLVELKSLETLAPVHKKQLLTYLKVSGKQLGLLINFCAPLIKNGIVRIANGVIDESPALSDSARE